MRRAEHLEPLNIHAGKRRTLFNFFLFSTLIAAPLLFLALYYGGSKYSVFITAFVIKQIIFLYPLIRVRQFDYFEPVIFAILLSPLGDYRIIYLMLYEDFYPELSPGISQEEAVRLGSQVMIYQAISFISLYVGYYSRLGQNFAKRLPVPKDMPWNRKKLVLLVLILTFIGVSCYLFVTVSLAGSPMRFFTYVEIYKRQLGPYLTFLRGIYLLSAAGLIWYCYYLTQKRSILFWPYFLGVAGVMLTLGQRSNVIFPFFTLLILYHYLKKPLQPWKIAGFTVLVIIFAVVAQDVRQSRYSTRTGEIDLRVVKEREYEAVDIVNDWIKDRRSFDTFVEIVRRVPDEIDLQYGKTYAYLLVMPVPRWVWPDKTQFLRENVVDDAKVVNASQPPGFLTGLYINFHLPGIIIGSFLWGICLRALYSWLKKNRDNRSVVLIYVVTLAYLGAGPTTLAISTWLNYLLPITLTIWFLQRSMRNSPGRIKAGAPHGS